jgi:hypothetical protein
VTADKELLVVDRDRHVTVAVDVRLDLEVLERIEDAAAQRVLVGGRGEVGQCGGIGHGSTVSTP